ncbi:MAG: [Clostridia bacterium]|nr:[FeFe] hydrogenase H-cluster maturation GTPase HydF [Clostridia bacterium]
MSLNSTPNAERLHIGIFGKRNAGKSTLINALTGQEVAITSPYAGTTADPVQKACEIYPIGPCVIIDTAGFDDEGELGRLRVEKTREVIKKCDLAIMVFTDGDIDAELAFIEEIKAQKVPVISVVNKIDIGEHISDRLECPILVSALESRGIEDLRNAIIKALPPDFSAISLTAHLIKEGDTVLLVMPQDIQAPKGRLILPQVQTIRNLLDEKCTVVCATAEGMEKALSSLKAPPKLIICDSQCFKPVYEKKPESSLLTSFSVLFARYKGDIDAFEAGASAIDALKPGDRVLIAEACTHNAQDGDIARVKIPNLLRKKVGGELIIDFATGTSFGDDLGKYKLIIHCGACMFNRKYVLSRIEQAKRQGVPITNYGIALAKLTEILPYVELR